MSVAITLKLGLVPLHRHEEHEARRVSCSAEHQQMPCRVKLRVEPKRPFERVAADPVDQLEA